MCLPVFTCCSALISKKITKIPDIIPPFLFACLLFSIELCLAAVNNIPLTVLNLDFWKKRKALIQCGWGIVCNDYYQIVSLDCHFISPGDQNLQKRYFSFFSLWTSWKKRFLCCFYLMTKPAGHCRCQVQISSLHNNSLWY